MVDSLGVPERDGMGGVGWAASYIARRVKADKKVQLAKRGQPVDKAATKSVKASEKALVGAADPDKSVGAAEDDLPTVRLDAALSERFRIEIVSKAWGSRKIGLTLDLRDQFDADSQSGSGSGGAESSAESEDVLALPRTTTPAMVVGAGSRANAPLARGTWVDGTPAKTIPVRGPPAQGTPTHGVLPKAVQKNGTPVKITGSWEVASGRKRARSGDLLPRVEGSVKAAKIRADQSAGQSQDSSPDLLQETWCDF